MIEKVSITDLVKANIGQPYSWTLNLAQVVTELECPISGKVIAIWNAPTSQEYIYIRFNRRDANQIRFTRGKVLAVPFTKLYITVPAGQTGNMEILYGPDAFEVLRIYPNPPEYDTALVDILTRLTEIAAELRGDTAAPTWGTEITVGVTYQQILASNANRRSFAIQAKSTNSGKVYLGYDNTVSTTKWIAELQAGQAYCRDDYRGDIYAIATAADQKVGYTE